MTNQVRRNPVPSLLKSLMNERLDPGYRAAAQTRDQAHARQSRLPSTIWLIIAAVLTGFILTYAGIDAARRIPGTQQERSELLTAVRDIEGRIDEIEDRRDELSGQVDDARASALAGDAEGSQVLGDLTNAAAAAAAEPVRGPGIVVTLADPPPRPGLSDSASRTVAGRAVVLDRDLQMVVNALWRDGAEAVAVDGVRVGPNVTIRQAGGAMLVDNWPVFSPYEISAIGAQGPLQTGFVVSDAYLRMSSVQQLYGIGFAVAENGNIDLPAASLRSLHEAQPHRRNSPGER